jgi:hypothetical protein
MEQSEIRWRYALDTCGCTEQATSGWAPSHDQDTRKTRRASVARVTAHFKCVPCKARVWREGDAIDHADDLCPGCGGPLEAVVHAEELIGLRALRTRPRERRSIADQVRDTIARNDAARSNRLHSLDADERPRHSE